MDVKEIGNTGKIDNCVVSVHIAYTAGDFQ